MDDLHVIAVCVLSTTVFAGFVLTIGAVASLCGCICSTVYTTKV
nr:MAG: putative P6 protein [Barley yellow dwarf virus MAV]WGH51161.1 MAG: putative P6 protein [Barley yellow dwarf virus MAV]WGH51168.1 MAG: putative P6 protein [Barley yellow dwarf virus MAV]WGH51175.1 MAG: putative P6 protein [Barley yellow dwarf virus MAV]WGH51182.1 MAG: putative P6 protein [Barley yellow dwarf virus MAV]